MARAKSKPVGTAAPMLRYRYKLFGLDTVNGESCPSVTPRFYETLEEAVQTAESYCSRGNNPPNGIVIFKAIQVVRPVGRPVEVVTLED